MKPTINSCKKLLLAVVLLASLPVGVDAAMVKTAHQALPALKSKLVVNGSDINGEQLLKQSNSLIGKELSGIFIGNIPDPLGEIIIEREELQKKLGSFAAKVSIPEKITIRRNGAILRGSEVAKRIMESCRKNEGELIVDLSRVPANIVLPGNVISWTVVSNAQNQLGMKLFTLDVNTEEGPYRQLIQVRVSKRIEAAQLTRLVKPGEALVAGTIVPKMVELKSDLSNAPATYKEVLGKTAGRYKSAGTILRSNDVDDTPANSRERIVPAQSSTAAISQLNKKVSHIRDTRDSWVIKPGESVNFVFNSGTLSMSIPAKAVQGGQAGDEITLINLQNKRRVRGVIKEKGVVEYAQR